MPKTCPSSQNCKIKDLNCLEEISAFHLAIQISVNLYCYMEGNKTVTEQESISAFSLCFPSR